MLSAAALSGGVLERKNVEYLLWYWLKWNVSNLCDYFNNIEVMKKKLESLNVLLFGNIWREKKIYQIKKWFSIFKKNLGFVLFYFFICFTKTTIAGYREKKIRKSLSPVENYCITNLSSIIFFHVYFDHWVKKIVYPNFIENANTKQNILWKSICHGYENWECCCLERS